MIEFIILLLRIIITILKKIIIVWVAIGYYGEIHVKFITEEINNKNYVKLIKSTMRISSNKFIYQ